jgi:signal transduction histidine kinase
MVKSPNREATRSCDRELDVETALTDLAALAAQVCTAPIALIWLNGVERIWAKSAIECDLQAIVGEITRSLADVDGDAPVQTTVTLDQTAVHPTLYALIAVPLLASEGIKSWVCVLDRFPRQWDAGQQEALRMLSRQIVRLRERQANAIRLEQMIQQIEQALRRSNQRFQQAQTQLIQAEKMSSLGQMLAGVAHEVNNPVSFLHGNLIYVNQYIQNLLELLDLYQQNYPKPTAQIQQRIEAIDLDFLVEDLPKTLISMKVGADRIRQIVLSLRNFSRLDENEKNLTDIHAGLDDTLVILQHRLKATAKRCGIEVIKKYGQISPVECYAGQLNQVFMNLLANAIDAFDQAGEQRDAPQIYISTEMNFQPVPAIMIRIRDNGSGMKAETCDRIFDPFFTTKPNGKGTGLGLSISYEIVVERHKGRLNCWSEPGQGTEFSIELPVQTEAINQATYLAANSTRPTTRPAA